MYYTIIHQTHLQCGLLFHCGFSPTCLAPSQASQVAPRGLDSGALVLSELLAQGRGQLPGTPGWVGEIGEIWIR